MMSRRRRAGLSEGSDPLPIDGALEVFRLHRLLDDIDWTPQDRDQLIAQPLDFAKIFEAARGKLRAKPNGDIDVRRRTTLAASDRAKHGQAADAERAQLVLVRPESLHGGVRELVHADHHARSSIGILSESLLRTHRLCKQLHSRTRRYFPRTMTQPQPYTRADIEAERPRAGLKCAEVAKAVGTTARPYSEDKRGPCRIPLERANAMLASI